MKKFPIPDLKLLFVVTKNLPREKLLYSQHVASYAGINVKNDQCTT